MYLPYVQLQNKRKNSEASDVATEKFITWKHNIKWLYNKIYYLATCYIHNCVTICGWLFV